MIKSEMVDVAQLVEQPAKGWCVVGSNPSIYYLALKQKEHSVDNREMGDMA